MQIGVQMWAKCLVSKVGRYGRIRVKWLLVKLSYQVRLAKSSNKDHEISTTPTQHFWQMCEIPLNAGAAKVG